MKYILIHTPVGKPDINTMKAAIGIVKSILKDPSSIVPGGKVLAAYSALGQWLYVCVWEAPSMESLIPLINGLRDANVNTKVIPAETINMDLIAKWEDYISKMK